MFLFLIALLTELSNILQALLMTSSLVPPIFMLNFSTSSCVSGFNLYPFAIASVMLFCFFLIFGPVQSARALLCYKDIRQSAPGQRSFL